MRLYIERFVIPLLSAACSAVLVGTWKLPSEVRIPCVVLIGVAAAIATFFISRNRDAEEHREAKSEKTANVIWGFLAVAIASGAIGWLIHLSPRSEPNTTSGSISQGAAQNPAGGLRQAAEPKTGTDVQPGSTPASETANTDPGLVKDSSSVLSIPPKSALLDYIKAPKRDAKNGNGWPVLVYGDDGSDFPILRARTELVLQNSGKSTPQIFAEDITPGVFKQLFNADAATTSILRDYCDGVALGMVRSATSKSDEIDGLYTTHLHADLKLVPVLGGASREIGIDEDGAGVSADESKSRAEERLADKLKVALSGLLLRE